MISSITPLTAAFCILRGIEDVEKIVLEGSNIGEFWEVARVVSLPAGAITGVDASLLFHIWYTPIGAGGSRSISWKMQLFVFSVEVLLG